MKGGREGGAAKEVREGRADSVVDLAISDERRELHQFYGEGKEYHASPSRDDYGCVRHGGRSSFLEHVGSAVSFCVP